MLILDLILRFTVMFLKQDLETWLPSLMTIFLHSNLTPGKICYAYD